MLSRVFAVKRTLEAADIMSAAANVHELCSDKRLQLQVLKCGDEAMILQARQQWTGQVIMMDDSVITRL